MAVRIRQVPPPLREGTTGQVGILVRLVVLAVLGLVALVISSVAG
jgi:hypothetical protein